MQECKEIGGVEGSFFTQCIGVLVTVVYASVVTAVILKIIDVLVGLRVTAEQETEGLDYEQHGEQVV